MKLVVRGAFLTFVRNPGWWKLPMGNFWCFWIIHAGQWVSEVMGPRKKMVIMDDQDFAGLVLKPVAA